MAKINSLAELQELQITIKMGDEVVKRNLKEDLAVDIDHINEVLIQNPGKTAYYNTLFQRIKSQADKVQARLRKIEATADKTIRLENPEATETQIKNLVVLNEERLAAEAYLLELREQQGLLAAAIEAMKDMRSTLISLSSNMRAELGGVMVKQNTIKTMQNAYEERMKEKFTPETERDDA